MSTRTDQVDDMARAILEWGASHAAMRDGSLSWYTRAQHADEAARLARVLRDSSGPRSVAYDAWEGLRDSATRAAAEYQYRDDHPGVELSTREEIPALPVTLSEAAQLLGIAAATLRVAANRGSLHAQRSQTPRGVVWHVTMREVERYRAEKLGKPGRKAKAVEEAAPAMFTTINDAYRAFEEYFGSDPCPWDRDTFQVWMQANGHRRYEDSDQDVMDAAYAACIAEITGAE